MDDIDSMMSDYLLRVFLSIMIFCFWHLFFFDYFQWDVLAFIPALAPVFKRYAFSAVTFTGFFHAMSLNTKYIIVNPEATAVILIRYLFVGILAELIVSMAKRSAAASRSAKFKRHH